MPHSRGIEITQVLEWNDGGLRRVEDYLAGEEPLEMRAGRQRLEERLTPGAKQIEIKSAR